MAMYRLRSMGGAKYTVCTKCRMRLKIKKAGFAERCKCRGEMGILEATDKLYRFMKNPSILRGGDASNNNDTIKNGSISKTSIGLNYGRNSLTKKNK